MAASQTAMADAIHEGEAESFELEKPKGGRKRGKVKIHDVEAGPEESFQSKKSNPKRGEYNVYSTFQSHEPEFDYLKSLEIEEKINKIRWLKRKNPAHFLLSTNGKHIISCQM